MQDKPSKSARRRARRDKAGQAAEARARAVAVADGETAIVLYHKRRRKTVAFYPRDGWLRTDLFSYVPGSLCIAGLSWLAAGMGWRMADEGAAVDEHVRGPADG